MVARAKWASAACSRAAAPLSPLRVEAMKICTGRGFWEIDAEAKGDNDGAVVADFAHVGADAGRHAERDSKHEEQAHGAKTWRAARSRGHSINP